MAVTKIWPVRDRFDKVLDYAANAKKTDADIEKYNALDGVASEPVGRGFNNLST